MAPEWRKLWPSTVAQHAQAVPLERRPQHFYSFFLFAACAGCPPPGSGPETGLGRGPMFGFGQMGPCPYLSLAGRCTRGAGSTPRGLTVAAVYPSNQPGPISGVSASRRVDSDSRRGYWARTDARVGAAAVSQTASGAGPTVAFQRIRLADGVRPAPPRPGQGHPADAGIGLGEAHRSPPPRRPRQG